MEFTLLWAALTAFVASFIGIRLTKPAVPDRPLDRLIGAALAGLAVGRIAAMIMQGSNPITSPAELLVIRGGVDTVWASLTGVVVLVWSLRKAPHALDALAPAAVAGLAGWHAGCVWRSTCLGTGSDMPWAWALPGSDVTRHPVEVYAALLFLAGAFILHRVKQPSGTAAALAICWAGFTRLATEPVRPGIGMSLWRFYALAAVVGLVAAVWLSTAPWRRVNKATAGPYSPP